MSRPFLIPDLRRKLDELYLRGRNPEIQQDADLARKINRQTNNINIWVSGSNTRRPDHVPRKWIPVICKLFAVTPETLSLTDFAAFKAELEQSAVILHGNDTVSGVRIDQRIETQVDIDAPVSSDALSSYSVRDMHLEYCFVDDSPRFISDFRTLYHDAWIDYDPWLELAYRTFIPREQERVELSGQTFDNNGTYSLRRIDVSRPEGQDGQRNNVYTLHLYPSEYYRFAFPNMRFDESFYDPDVGHDVTYREKLGLAHYRVRIDNFDQFPIHFRVAANLILVTSDNYVIATMRSRKQYVAREGVHASVAEGMYRSMLDDNKSDMYRGVPSPFATVRRALHDELNVDAQDVPPIEEIQCLGICADTKRAQPLFVFFHKSRKLRVKDVLTCWARAPKDKHENKYVFGIEWKLQNVAHLFRGVRPADINYEALPQDRAEIETNVEKLEFSSNHAQMDYFMALWRCFGFKSVTDTLCRRE